MIIWTLGLWIKSAEGDSPLLSHTMSFFFFFNLTTWQLRWPPSKSFQPRGEPKPAGMLTPLTTAAMTVATSSGMTCRLVNKKKCVHSNLGLCGYPWLIDWDAMTPFRLREHDKGQHWRPRFENAQFVTLCKCQTTSVAFGTLTPPA